MRQGLDHPSERSLPQVPENTTPGSIVSGQRFGHLSSRSATIRLIIYVSMYFVSSPEHMGKADVERHISTPMHVSNAKATKSQSSEVLKNVT